MTPSFETVEPGERRFRLMDLPVFESTLTTEQLSKVDAITAERWKLDNVMGQKIDWLVRGRVEDNNNWYLMETEIIRSKQFRRWLWVRITLGAVMVVWAARKLGFL